MTDDDFQQWRDEISVSGFKALVTERNDAQEAAEEYWEAWQDAAVYWKHERDCWKEKALLQERELIEALRDRDHLKIRLEAVTENRDLMQEEGDEWRDAFRRYKAHDYECDRIRLDGNEDPSRPCTCGLDRLMETR